MIKLLSQRKPQWHKVLIGIFFNCIGRSRTLKNTLILGYFFPSGLRKFTLKDNIESLPQFFKKNDFKFDDETIGK